MEAIPRQVDPLPAWRLEQMPGDDGLWSLLALATALFLLWKRGFGNLFAGPAAWWVLLLLALPVIPVLRGCLGYPLRLLAGVLVVPLLHLAGFAVERSDTTLSWSDHLFEINERCSGVGKLWAALFLACVLAWLHRLSVWRTGIVLAVAVPAAVVGNTLRVAALFYLEVVLSPYPAWLHDGVGAAAFALTAGLILVAVRKLASAETRA